MSRVLVPLDAAWPTAAKEPENYELYRCCPLFFMVNDWMVVAKEFLTANTWQLLAWGMHLVQIFIIGLLSLSPADRRKTDLPPNIWRGP